MSWSPGAHSINQTLENQNTTPGPRAEEGQTASHQPQVLGKTGRSNKREEAEEQQQEQGRRSSSSERLRAAGETKGEAAGTRASKRCSLAPHGPTSFPGEGGSGEQRQRQVFPLRGSSFASNPGRPASPARQPGGPRSLGEGGSGPSFPPRTSRASPRGTNELRPPDPAPRGPGATASIQSIHPQSFALPRPCSSSVDTRLCLCLPFTATPPNSAHPQHAAGAPFPLPQRSQRGWSTPSQDSGVCLPCGAAIPSASSRRREGFRARAQLPAPQHQTGLFLSF